MSSYRTSIFVTALLASSLGAQSFNLDVNDSPTGLVPANMFGAFPGQTGVWDSIGITSIPIPMVDISGGTPGATYRVFSSGTLSIQNLTAADYGTPPSDVDVRRLYDDYVVATPNNSNVTVEFANLAPGRYRFYVYTWTPNGSTPLRFSVGSTVRQANTNHGFPFPTPPDFVTGQTFAARTLTVQTGETVTIRTTCTDQGNGGGVNTGEGGNGEGAGPDGESCTIAGIQIVPVGGTQGCDQAYANSVGGFPRINALGTTNAAGEFDSSVNGGAGDIVLSAGSLPGGLPAMRLILTFASNGIMMPGVPQIQPSCGNLPEPGITRCLDANGMIRINTPTVITNPAGVFVTPINLLDLATQGLNASAGDTIHFQMIYEDASVPDDLCNADPILRWTRSLSITLF